MTPLQEYEAEYEAEALRLAREGDAEARRELLALAADALRRGAPHHGPPNRELSLSADVREWLADGLVSLLAAPEAPPLAVFGLGPLRRGRPARDEQTAMMRTLARAAAVHLLTARAGSRTEAVQWVAAAAGCEPDAVWKELKRGSEWTGTARQAMGFARPLIRQARALGLLSRNRPISG